jgi:primosomal protein N''
VTSQYRPLNLIIAGLQLAATLMNQGQSLWTQFKTLKHAPNPQAAAQALQQLSTTLNKLQQASSQGLQNPGAWFAANAPAAFTQDVGTGAAGAAGATPPPAAQAQSSATPNSRRTRHRAVSIRAWTKPNRRSKAS